MVGAGRPHRGVTQRMAWAYRRGHERAAAADKASRAWAKRGDFVITVRHSQTPDLAAVRRRMEADPDLLRLGPEAVLYAIVDSVVDGYAPVVAGLQKDIDEIETEVFRGDPPGQPPHLRAVARGDRLPALRPAAAGHAERAAGRVRQVWDR